MTGRAAVDANDWRTWPRNGRRLLPPPDATQACCMRAMCEFSAAAWGVDPNRPRKNRRNVVRVLKRIDGKYVQIRHTRVVNGHSVDVRVRGGCRPGAQGREMEIRIGDDRVG